MPDSVGAGGFPNNINIGHEHLDISSGFTYQYTGGVSSNILNWRIIGGSSPTDPSTSGWTSKQAGAEWFNTSERVYKYFDGFVVRTFESTAYIYIHVIRRIILLKTIWRRVHRTRHPSSVR